MVVNIASRPSTDTLGVSVACTLGRGFGVSAGAGADLGAAGGACVACAYTLHALNAAIAAHMALAILTGYIFVIGFAAPLSPGDSYRAGSRGPWRGIVFLMRTKSNRHATASSQFIVAPGIRQGIASPGRE